jgi:hypothetical protein
MNDKPHQNNDRPQKQEKREKSVVWHRRQARLKKVRDQRQDKRVRVEPVNQRVRETIAHPFGGRFPATGSTEWPNDSFTKRRIRDGDIKLAADQQQRPQEQRKEQKPAERHSAARRPVAAAPPRAPTRAPTGS